MKITIDLAYTDIQTCNLKLVLMVTKLIAWALPGSLLNLLWIALNGLHRKASFVPKIYPL